jgi:hypothetical protein
MTGQVPSELAVVQSVLERNLSAGKAQRLALAQEILEQLRKRDLACKAKLRAAVRRGEGAKE